MGDDKGDEITDTIARAATALAIDKTIEHTFHALAGVPLGSLAIEIVRGLIPSADKRLQAALVQELLDDILKLNNRVEGLGAELNAQGQKLDDLGKVRVAAILQDFLRALSKTYGDEKRAALVCATAHQFDPRLGSPAVRRYWLDLLTSLTDVEVALLQLIIDHSAVDLHAPPVKLSNETLVAYHKAATSLAIRDRSLIGDGPDFKLGESGRILAKFMK